MALTRTQKEQIVDNLKERLSQAASVVFVNFHGLGVGDETDMRQALSSEGVSYTVAKKSLVKIALSESSLDGEMPALEGEIALAFGDDPTKPAQQLFEFGQKFGGSVAIVGGVFEGKYKDGEEMNEIAQIPDIKTLRGMFANVINSPIQGLVVALDAVATKKA